VGEKQKARRLGQSRRAGKNFTHRFSNICNAPASWLKSARNLHFTPFGPGNKDGAPTRVMEGFAACPVYLCGAPGTQAFRRPGGYFTPISRRLAGRSPIMTLS
jgi:hypothetical protein